MVAPTKYNENFLFSIIKFCCRIGVNLKIEFPSEDKRLKGKNIKINMDCRSAIDSELLNKYNKIYNSILLQLFNNNFNR